MKSSEESGVLKRFHIALFGLSDPAFVLPSTATREALPSCRREKPTNPGETATPQLRRERLSRERLEASSAANSETSAVDSAIDLIALDVTEQHSGFEKDPFDESVIHSID